jgi:hypothetical protein
MSEQYSDQQLQEMLAQAKKRLDASFETWKQEQFIKKQHQEELSQKRLAIKKELDDYKRKLLQDREDFKIQNDIGNKKEKSMRDRSSYVTTYLKLAGKKKERFNVGTPELRRRKKQDGN